MGLFENSFNKNNKENIEREKFSINKLSVYISDDLMFANIFYDKTNITCDENFIKLFPKMPMDTAIEFLDDLCQLLTSVIKEKMEKNKEENNIIDLNDKNEKDDEVKTQALGITEEGLIKLTNLYNVDFPENPTEDFIADLLIKYATDVTMGLVEPIEGISDSIHIFDKNEIENSKKKQCVKSSSFSSDTIGFELFKKINKKIAPKYSKYLDITL